MNFIVLIMLLFSFQACLASEPINSEKPKMKKMVGVYWGAFDPPTVAHQAIIIEALNKIPLEKIIIVVNDHGYKNYTYSLETRLELMRDILRKNRLTNVELLWQDEKQKIDYPALRRMTKMPICAIAGYDAYRSWIKHAAISERNRFDAIAVIPRGDETPLLSDSNAFLMPIGEIYKHVSSSKVKQEASLRIAERVSKASSERKISTR